MHQQPFRTEELQAELERTLGFKLGPLVRIGGGGAINFKAERVSDGLQFVVKCFPPDRWESGERLLETLKTMEGVKTPVRLFAEALPAVLLDHLVFCLSWQEGEVIAPDRLTDEQWDAFLDDYQRLSERMQLSVPADPIRPLLKWWQDLRGACRGLTGRIFVPVLDDMHEEDLVFHPDLTRTIHGDLHPGNVLFEGGGVKCFMDLESFRPGYPPEDIACYCIAAVKRFGRTEGRQDRILAMFGHAARRLPYSPHEWRTAVNALCLMGMRKRVCGGKRIGLISACELTVRGKLFALFRRQIDVAERAGVA